MCVFQKYFCLLLVVVYVGVGVGCNFSAGYVHVAVQERSGVIYSHAHMKNVSKTAHRKAPRMKIHLRMCKHTAGLATSDDDDEVADLQRRWAVLRPAVETVACLVATLAGKAVATPV